MTTDNLPRTVYISKTQYEQMLRETGTDVVLWTVGVVVWTVRQQADDIALAPVDAAKALEEGRV